MAQPGSAAIHNVNWFSENHRYRTLQQTLPCYLAMRAAVENEIKGARQLLDIGNGGFFNYHTSLASRITAVDLFHDAEARLPGNIDTRVGSFLRLPCRDQEFDVVMQQNVLHHVTGRSARENHQNLNQCLREMFRCTEPGGKAVIMESTVGPIFHAFECLVFRVLRIVKTSGHPITFQFTPAAIVTAAKDAGFQIETLRMIPRGTWLIQFGWLWPSVLTPARPMLLVLRRPRSTENN